MRMTVLDGYSYIAFSCIVCDLDRVVAKARIELLDPDWVIKMTESTGALDLARIYVGWPQPGGAHPSKVVFFAPTTSRGVTVLFANRGDGWMTLAVRLSMQLGVPVYMFDLSGPTCDSPRNALTYMVGGQDRRHVSVMQDDRWVFWQKGDPLPEEDVSLYSKRRIKDRLTREHLVTLATRLGFPIGDDRFWQSDSKATYFEEHRTP